MVMNNMNRHCEQPPRLTSIDDGRRRDWTETMFIAFVMPQYSNFDPQTNFPIQNCKYALFWSSLMKINRELMKTDKKFTNFRIYVINKAINR